MSFFHLSPPPPPPLSSLFKSHLGGQFSSCWFSEFDKFLAERAEACGQRTGSAKSGANRPRQRQMQMENQADDEMFGL